MKPDEAIKRLERAFYDWISSNEFEKFSDFIKKFHKYSFHNILMIYAQKPNASLVAGFNAWRKLGRNVLKGEKGIAIFAPNTYTYKTVNDDGEEERKQGVRGFRIVYVFDVSQTEGEPIPECKIEEEYDLDSVIEMVEGMGYSVEFYDESHGERGYVRKGEKTIHVHNGESSGQQASTILHEWCHLKLDQELERDDEEIVVQTGSYLIAAKLGLDTSWYTAQYIESWSQGKKWKEISKLFTLSDNLFHKFFNAAVMA